MTREAEVGLVPRSIRLPDRSGAKLVYLDMRDWITLSKARMGHPQGKAFKGVLRTCLAAAEAGTAIFPLSQHIYNEIRKIPPWRQRQSRDLSKLMSMLSSYRMIMARSEVARHETEGLLDKVLWPSESPVPPKSFVNELGLFSAGGLVNQAFGQVRVFFGTGKRKRDITDPLRSWLAGLDEDQQQTLHHKILTGPSLAEVPSHRRYGWNPEASLKRYEWIADDQNRLARLLDDAPALREPEELHRIISAFEFDRLSDVFCPSLGARLAARGFNTSKLNTRTKLHILSVVAQLDRMPSFDVAVSLQVSLHQNPRHEWKSNHVFDYETLAITVPYCDIVMTDNEMRHHIQRTKLDQRMETCVISKLIDLPDALKQ